MRKIILILASGLLLCCANNKESSVEVDIAVSTSNNSNLNYNTHCTDTLLLLTDFPSFPFKVKYITRNWIINKFGIKKNNMIFEEQRVDPNFIDSTIFIEVNKSKIKFHINAFYKPIDNSFYNPLYDSLYNKNIFDTILSIQSADIRDASIILDRGVKVGMKKDIFFRTLYINNVNHDCDTIFMTDEEWQCYHRFYFSNDTLSRIVLQFMD